MPKALRLECPCLVLWFYLIRLNKSVKDCCYFCSCSVIKRIECRSCFAFHQTAAASVLHCCYCVLGNAVKIVIRENVSVFSYADIITLVLCVSVHNCCNLFTSDISIWCELCFRNTIDYFFGSFPAYRSV